MSDKKEEKSKDIFEETMEEFLKQYPEYKKDLEVSYLEGFLRNLNDYFWNNVKRDMVGQMRHWFSEKDKGTGQEPSYSLPEDILDVTNYHLRDIFLQMLLTSDDSEANSIRGSIRSITVSSTFFDMMKDYKEFFEGREKEEKEHIDRLNRMFFQVAIAFTRGFYGNNKGAMVLEYFKICGLFDRNPEDILNTD